MKVGILSKLYSMECLPDFFHEYAVGSERHSVTLTIHKGNTMLAIQAPTMNIAGFRIMQKLAMGLPFPLRAFPQHPHGLLSATKAGVCWRRPYCSIYQYQQQGLIPWIRQQGGHVGPLELQYNKLDGWTMRTTEGVKAGETLITLPSHLPLSFQSVHKPVRHLFDHMPVDETWDIKLALTLLSERAKNGSSSWWPYIQGLPRRFDQLPVFSYSSDEMQALEDPVLISELKQKRERMHKLTNEALLALFIKASAPGIGSFFMNNNPEGAFAWAMAAATSRSFDDESIVLNATLLPLVDMCNHSFAPKAIVAHERSYHSHAAGLEWKVIAAKDLDRGESAEVNYGKFNNKDLLLIYGFLIPKNPYDRVFFPYDGQLLDQVSRMQKLDSSFRNPTPWQQALLLQLKLHAHHPSEQVSLGGSGLVDGRLLAALRLMHHAQDSNVDLETLKDWGQTPPLGVVNEVKVLLTLKALAERLLATTYSTSVSEDDKILADDSSDDIPLTPNLRVAIQYRRSQKQLLLDTVTALEAKLSTMSN